MLFTFYLGSISLGRAWTPLSPLVIIWIAPLISYKDGLGIKWSTQLDIPLNKENWTKSILSHNELIIKLFIQEFTCHFNWHGVKDFLASGTLSNSFLWFQGNFNFWRCSLRGVFFYNLLCQSSLFWVSELGIRTKNLLESHWLLILSIKKAYITCKMLLGFLTRSGYLKFFKEFLRLLEKWWQRYQSDRPNQ